MSAARKTLDEVACHLHREARFPDTAHTRDCNQPHVLAKQQFLRRSHFLLTPDKSGPLHGNIRRACFCVLSLFFREAVAYRREFPCEILSRGVALIGLFLQTSLDGPAQRSR